jgi:site-specific recombinase XerD
MSQVVPLPAGQPTVLPAMLTAPLETLDPEHRAEAVALRYLAGYSGNTRKAYARDLTDWFGWLDVRGLVVLEATRSTVDLYARHLDEQGGLSRSTIARRLSTLAGYYRYAESEGAVARNPVSAVRRPRTSQDSPTLGLSKTEARQLLDQAAHDGPRTEALVTLLLLTGCRVGEALALTVTDLSVDKGHRVATLHGKGGKKRRLPIPAAAAHALDTYLAGRDAGPVFTTATGRPWAQSSVFRTIRRLARDAGVPHHERVTPHSLRHTAATLALDANAPLRDVQDMLGHADPRTTRRYDRGRHNLDRSPAYTLAATLAG